MNIEEATARWHRLMVAKATYPELAAYLDYQRKWAKQHDIWETLRKRAEEANAKQSAMYDELKRLKALLPPEAKEAIE